MNNKLIDSLKNVLSYKKINDFIKAGELFYEEFCKQIIYLSKNDNLETIKEICTEISKTDTEFIYLSPHFNNPALEELMFINNLFSRAQDAMHSKTLSLFMKLGNNPQIMENIIHTYNQLNTLCQNFIYIDLKKFINGLDKIKFSSSYNNDDIDIKSIINILNSLFEEEHEQTEVPLDYFTLLSYITRTAEQVSYSCELKLIIPLLLLLEKIIPLNPLDIISGFNNFTHMTEAAEKKNNLRNNLPSLIDLYIKLCEKSRTEGLLSLEDDIEELEDKKILSRSLQLIVDGTEPDLVKNIIGNKIKSELSLINIKNKMIIEGILSVQSGDNPRIIEEKLKAIYTCSPELDTLAAQFVDLSEKARREGILALENNIDELNNPILYAGLTMVLHGMHPLLVKIIMEMLSEIIFKYNNLYYQICLEGTLSIQNGRSPEKLKILLKSMVPSFRNKKSLTTNNDLVLIFENSFRLLKQDEEKDELAILISELIRHIAVIASQGICIDSIFKNLLNTKENNRIISLTNKLLVNAVQNNPEGFNQLDFSELNEYLNSKIKELSQIIKNDELVKKKSNDFSEHMNEKRIKSFNILRDY